MLPPEKQVQALLEGVWQDYMNEDWQARYTTFRTEKILVVLDS